MPIFRNLAGTSLTAPARGSLTFNLISLDLPEAGTKEYDTTLLNSSIESSAAAPCLKVGDMGAEIEFDPAQAIPIGAADEVWRITFPLQGVQTVAAKQEYTGHIMSVGDPKATVDGRAVRTLKIKINSVGTFTAGT